MEFLSQLLDIFIHLDEYLATIIDQYGTLTYLLLFIIIFCETGLVIAPFLPGDSLLFAAGAFAARGSFSVAVLLLLLAAAAVLGDATNYAVGAYVGPKLFLRKLHLLKQEHLDRAHAFYEKYGGKAIIFARFLPIFRTVVPFVAGMANMTYRDFAVFNVTGGIAWVSLFTLAGFLFGNIPAVEKNFSLMILAIIVVSLIPATLEISRQWFMKRSAKRGQR